MRSIAFKELCMLSINFWPKTSINIEPGHINMHFVDNWTRITKK